MFKIDFEKLGNIQWVDVDDLPDFDNFPAIKKKNDDVKALFERIGIPDFIKNASKENIEKTDEQP